MSVVVIIGAQWGDEGKGKITDYLTESADLVVRYQGGNNAGHTVKSGNTTYKMHLVPSGTIQGKTSIIGNGVAVDPVWLVSEMETLAEQGVSFDNLIIDKRANLIMPYHRLLDELSEKSLGSQEIGTTKKGIGPCYTDKFKRVGIRVCDLMNPDEFARKLTLNLRSVNEELVKIYDVKPLNFADIYNEYMMVAEKLRGYVEDASVITYNNIKSHKKVLFEGAQGTLLDIDFGTYPFVTSSHPTSAGVCVGAGIGPTAIDRVIGITKAYTTRVGKGPFPTELEDATGRFLREAGGEYGTTTGRPRRCGWLDMVIVNFAVRINGLSSIALTKLDTLTGLDVVKICVGYAYKNEVITDFPAELSVLADCVPIYEEMPGWHDDITKAKTFEELCPAAQAYVKRIEELSGTPVGIVSVGPDRAQTIVREDCFAD